EVGDRFLEQSPTAFFYQPAKTAANKNVFVGALQLGLPTTLDPALALATHYNFFRQDDIDRATSFDGLEETRNAARHGMMQNKVAKALGISPAKASHLLRSYLPGLRGNLLVDLPNALAGQPGDPTDYRAADGQ